MIKSPLTEDSLQAAFGRIRDFQAVNGGKGNYEEAFVVLRESLGLNDERIGDMHLHLEGLFPEEARDDPTFVSGVLFGLIVGLIAADYATEA